MLTHYHGFSAKALINRTQKLAQLRVSPRVDERRAAMLIFLNGAPVAQLDRASGYEPEGREFESPRAHHFLRICSPLRQIEVHSASPISMAG